MPKIIGLTGPIGAGKDEVAKVLRRRKVSVVDADRVAHTLYKPQSEVWHGLVRAFGSRILNRGGAVNRRKLGELVFSDKGKLQQLNKIVHPYLKKAIIREVELRTQVVVINAAVLKEIGLVDHVDEVWVVTASRQKRMRRLLGQGLSKKSAAARLRSQQSLREYVRLADVVIENNGTRQQLAKKVLALLGA
ncbi:dephospho-CoA kinase [Candidatus Margulisiibacteriota bacterium]